MSLTTRRFLYIFFILIFLTITPILFLYAAGYKIGSGFNVQKTGILIIDTKPQNAKIYINGKIQQNLFKKYFSDEESILTTPIKIKGLLPGEYDIRLEVNNYWPWEKKLEIKSGQSTYIEDVSLFKIDLPLIIQSGDHQNFSLSPENKYLITDNDNVISKIRLSDETIVSYNSSTTQNIELPEQISWSDDGQKAIINDHLFYINKWVKPSNLKELIGDDIKNIKWNTNTDNKLYYASNGSIYLYDISKGESKSIVSGQNFSDYLPKDNNLYYVSKNDLEATLNVLNINNSKIVGKTNLPYSDYLFLSPNNRLINLYDKTHKILYLIDPFSNIKPLRETIGNVIFTDWIDDSKLLYANEFEIWILDMENANRNLITRVSHEIKDVFWHPSDNYIVYASEKQINIIELDDRDKYNITKIVELDSIKDILLNKKGDTLYFQSKIGNQEGVYRLPIQ